MRAKYFPVAAILIVGFALGALLGRRWRGAFADSVLSFVALLTAALLLAAVVAFLRKRRSVPGTAPTLTAASPPEPGAPEMIAPLPSRQVAPAVTMQRFTDFLLGIALALVAQFAMLRQEPLIARFVFADLLNSLFRIDVPNLDNVILAVVLFVFSGIFFAGGIAAYKFFDALLAERPWQLPKLGARAWKRLATIAISAALAFLFLLWRLSSGDNNLWLGLVWIAAIFLTGALVFALDRRGGVTLAPDLKRSDGVLVAAIVLAGLVIGAYKLAQIPNSLIGDEGTFWDTARSIAQWNYRPSLFDFGVYSYPILGSYYQAMILKVFGLSLWSWRFSSVLAGVAATVPTYLLAREMFDRRVAVLASALMIVTPYFLAFERLGYNNAQALFPVALTLYLVYAGLKRSSVFYLFLAGVAGGLGFYTYTAGRLGLVAAGLFFAYLLAAWLVQRRPIRTLLVLGVVLGVGWAVTTLPHLVYGNTSSPELLRTKTVESVFANDIYAHDFLLGEDLFRDIPPIKIGPYTLFYRPDLYARLLVRGAARTMLAFQHDKLVGDHFIASPLAGPGAAVFYFLGLVVALVNLRSRNFVLLAIWFFSGVLLLSIISTFPPRDAHLVAIIPAVSILSAVGIVTVADLVAAQIPAPRVLSDLFVMGCLGLVMFTGLNNYFVDVPQKYPPIAEHIIGFAALELQSPREVIYVYSNPQDRDFVPWEIRSIPNPADYHSVALQDLLNDTFGIDPNRSYLFFFNDQDQTETLRYLTRVLGRTISPQVYYNREGQVVLLSYAF